MAERPVADRGLARKSSAFGGRNAMSPMLRAFQNMKIEDPLRHSLWLQIDSYRTELRRLMVEASAGLRKPCGAALAPMG